MCAAEEEKYKEGNALKKRKRLPVMSTLRCFFLTLPFLLWVSDSQVYSSRISPPLPSGSAPARTEPQPP